MIRGGTPRLRAMTDAPEPPASPPPGEPPPPPPAAPPPPPAYVAATPEWRSNQGLKTALTWLFGVTAAAQLFLAVAYVNRLGVISDVEDQVLGGFDLIERANDADDLVQTAAILVLVLLVVNAICFITWMFRAAKNNEALGRANPRLGAGWAIGGWFIPLANFVIPVLVMQDLWRGSDPSTPRGDARWRIGARSALIGWWWALWLLGLLRGFADPDDPSTTLDDIKTSDTLSLLGSCFSAAAAILAILVVRRLTERQEACLRAQQQAWTSEYGGTPGSAPV